MYNVLLDVQKLELVNEIVNTPEPERTERFGTKWPDIVSLIMVYIIDQIQEMAKLVQA